MVAQNIVFQVWPSVSELPAVDSMTVANMRKEIKKSTTAKITGLLKGALQDKLRELRAERSTPAKARLAPKTFVVMLIVDGGLANRKTLAVASELTSCDSDDHKRFRTEAGTQPKLFLVSEINFDHILGLYPTNQDSELSTKLPAFWLEVSEHCHTNTVILCVLSVLT
jgi:hypothetical protein